MKSAGKSAAKKSTLNSASSLPTVQLNTPASSNIKSKATESSTYLSDFEAGKFVQSEVTGH